MSSTTRTGRRRRSRSRQYVRYSAPSPSSAPQAVSVNGPEGVAVVLQCSAQRRNRTNQVPRQPESSRCPAESARVEERNGGEQPNPGDSVHDVGRTVDGPVQRRTGLPLQPVRLLRPDYQPVVEVDLQFTGPEPVDDVLQQGDAVILRQVHADALGQQQCWSVGRDLVEPGRIGRRSGNQVVSRSGRKNFLAQRDYGRVVDVVPFHSWAGIQPEHSAVQTATQVDYGGILVSGQELGGPDVELGGSYRYQRRPAVGDLEFAPVVVDSGDSLLGESIAQDGPVPVGVQRLAVQGGQHRLRGTAEVDGNFVGHGAQA